MTVFILKNSLLPLTGILLILGGVGVIILGIVLVKLYFGLPMGD